MTVPNSKFDANDHIWFYNEWNGPRFLEGYIILVCRWENPLGFFYTIEHIGTDGELRRYDVAEDKIYSTKEEIGEAIFEPMGVLGEITELEQEPNQEP